MQILDAKINWFKGYGNAPELEVFVDDVPARSELRYRRAQDFDGCSYFAELGDYIDFFHHIYANERGYGGSVFNVILITGEQVAVKGPWSSNNQWMNRIFPRSVNVTYNIKSKGYRLAGHMIEDKAIELIRNAGADVCYLAGYGFDNELSEPNEDCVLAIKLPGMTYRESQKKKNE